MLFTDIIFTFVTFSMRLVLIRIDNSKLFSSVSALSNGIMMIH